MSIELESGIFYQLYKFFKDVDDVRAPLGGFASRRWSVDCTTQHLLDSIEHLFNLNNPQTLCSVESAVLAPRYKGS